MFSALLTIHHKPLILSMSNHRRLTTEEFQDRLRNVTDALYEEFVVPNPYHDPVRRTYREYPQLVDALIGSNFDFSFYPSRSGRPADSDGFAQQTVPTPVGAPLPALMPNDAHAVRCASNTVATGQRCGRAAFHPLTLCSVHFRYWKVHHFLPHGGARAPGMSHPDDLWQPPVAPAVWVTSFFNFACPDRGLGAKDWALNDSIEECRS